MGEEIYEVKTPLYSSEDLRVRVLAGTLKKNGTPVAIKLQLHGSMDEANVTIREAFNQISLIHPSICRVYDCYLSSTLSHEIESTLLLELMEHDLNHEIQNRASSNTPWSELNLISMMQSIVSALIFAKKVGVCHRDIKPQNIFISGQTVKIGDFGSSRRLLAADAGEYSLQGSPFYLSPELKTHFLSILETGSRAVEYDPHLSDVYSLGVTLLFMAKLRSPVRLANISTLREETKKLIGECGEYPKVQKMLMGMLEVDPGRRITFEALSTMMDEFLNPPPPCDPTPTLTPSPPDFLAAFSSSCSLHSRSLTARSQQTKTAQPCPQKEELKKPQTCEKCGRSVCDEERASKSMSSVSDVYCRCSEKAQMAPPCMICHRPCLSQSWVPRISSSLRPVLLFSLCSLACYEAYQSMLQEKCVHCQASIPSTAPRHTVQLPCTHSFHSSVCLYAYIQKVSIGLTSQVRYQCPACEINIPNSVLVACLGRGEEGVGLAKGKKCGRCKKALAVFVLDCGHGCCAACGSEDSVRCGVCNRTSKCTLF